MFNSFSLNEVTQVGQMDWYVRFLGHATANDLKAAFTENCKPLDPRKLLQISMDGSSVNLKLHRTLSSEIIQTIQVSWILEPVDCILFTMPLKQQCRPLNLALMLFRPHCGGCCMTHQHDARISRKLSKMSMFDFHSNFVPIDGQKM
jgi:hypothetical protein